MYGVGAAGTGVLTGAYVGARFKDEQNKQRTILGRLGLGLGMGLGAAARGAYGALRAG